MEKLDNQNITAFDNLFLNYFSPYLAIQRPSVLSDWLKFLMCYVVSTPGKKKTKPGETGLAVSLPEV